MIDVVYYLFNSLGASSRKGRLMLPKRVKVSQKRFNEILSTVTDAKNEGLRINVDGREITLNNTERLIICSRKKISTSKRTKNTDTRSNA